MKSFILEVTFLKYLSGKPGRIRAKFLRTPKNLPAPMSMIIQLWKLWITYTYSL